MFYYHGLVPFLNLCTEDCRWSQQRAEPHPWPEQGTDDQASIWGLSPGTGQIPGLNQMTSLIRSFWRDNNPEQKSFRSWLWCISAEFYSITDNYILLSELYTRKQNTEPWGSNNHLYLLKVPGERERERASTVRKNKRHGANLKIPTEAKIKVKGYCTLTELTKKKSAVTSAAHRLEAFQLNSSLLFQPNPLVFVSLSHVSMTYCYKQIWLICD